MKRLAITLLLLALITPAWGQDSMPAYVLFRMTDAADPNDQWQMQAGWPVSVHTFNPYGGGKIVLPTWGVVGITDATVDQIKTSYLVPWQQAIEWEFTSHDPATDTHSLNVFMKPELVSASGLNSLTRTQVENFLNKWGAVVDGISANSVQFTANVANAISSEGFWGLNVSGVIFEEKAYSSVTGIHTMEADYSGVPVTQSEVAGIVINRCGLDSIQNITPNKVTFSCHRDVVFGEFKEDVRMRIDGQFSLRKWRLFPAAIQAIIDAGGSLEVTKAQAIQALRHRLDD